MKNVLTWSRHHFRKAFIIYDYENKVCVPTHLCVTDITKLPFWGPRCLAFNFTKLRSHRFSILFHCKLCVQSQSSFLCDPYKNINRDSDFMIEISHIPQSQKCVRWKSFNSVLLSSLQLNRQVPLLNYFVSSHTTVKGINDDMYLTAASDLLKARTVLS